MSNIYIYIEYSNYVPKSTQIFRKLCKNPMRRTQSAFSNVRNKKCVFKVAPSGELPSIPCNGVVCHECKVWLCTE